MANTGQRKVSGRSAGSSRTASVKKRANESTASSGGNPREGSGDCTRGKQKPSKPIPESVVFRYVVKYYGENGKHVGSIPVINTKHASLLLQILNLGPQYGEATVGRQTREVKLKQEWSRVLLWYERPEGKMRVRAALWVESNKAWLVCFWWERFGKLRHPRLFYRGADAPYPNRVTRPCTANDDVPF